MNKFRKTLVVILSALFVLCMATFAACNSDSDAQAPEAPKAVYSVDVNVNDASLGTYTLTKANSGEGYTEGTVVTLTVTPKEDYDATLKINGTEVALDDNGSASFPVTRETQVEVNYNYKYQVYAYVAGGEGGTVELSDPVNGTQYAKNEPVTVTVTPKDGYDLKRVLVNGEEVETTKQDKAYKLNVEVDGRKYVVAEFVALHTVTVTNVDAKGDVALTADGEAVTLTQNAVILPEGTLVSLTVAPKEGESVKEVVVNGTPYFYEDDFTFELKKETTVEVVYDSYFKVTLPEATTGVQLQLVGAEEAKNGYLAGSVVTLKATLEEGYFVTEATVMVGEEGETDITDVLNAFGEYTFTVTDNVTVAVAVQSERDESYTVTVTYNNTNFGTARLSEEGEEGKYVYGTSLTLTVTPVSNYYKVDYVTIDGVRVEPDAGKTNEYTFTVLKDTNIHVVFVEATSYTVCFELGDLLKKGYGVTVNGTALEEPTNKNDTFLTHVAYEGEDLAAVAITEPTDPTQKAEGELFCTVNDVKTLYNGTSFDLGEINSNVTVYITVEEPAEPTVSASSEEELEQHSTMTQPISEFLEPIELDKENNRYIFTFTATVPEHAPVSDGTVYRFKGWQVTVNGVDVRDAYKPASAGIMLTAYEGYLFAPGESFAVEYNVDSAEMKVVIVPEWIETYTLTLAEVENCDITVTVDGDEQEGKPVGTDTVYTFDKDTSVTVTLEPKDNYRFNGITTVPEGLVKAPEGEEQYRAFTIQNLTIKENVTITVAPLVQYATVRYDVVYGEGVDSSLFTEAHLMKEGDEETGTVLEAGKDHLVDVGTNIYFYNKVPDSYQATIKGWTLKEESKIMTCGLYLGGDTTNTGTLRLNGTLTSQGLKLTITYEKLTQKVTVDAENATVTINGTQYSDTPIDCNVLKEVTVEVTPIGDYVIDKVTVVTTKGGTTVEVTEKEGKYTFTMPSEPVTLTVTTLPKLTVSFPNPDSPEESKGAPTQGTWAAVNSDDPDEPDEGNSLVIGANTLVVNGDPVTEITLQTEDAKGGDVVYELTTEKGETYTLAWFGKVEGYILALTDTTAGASLGRRAAPRAAEETTYYVNPDHVTDGAVAEGKISKLLGTWKPADGKILAFTVGESGTQVSLNGSLVKYLFALANNQYLLVVDTDAYDFTLTDTNTLTDNAAEVEYKKAYKVTVNETEVDGCSFTGVTDGEYVAYDAELTLTFTLAEGYEAKVAVDDAEAQVVTEPYTLTVEKDLTLHVTYAKKQYIVTVNEVGEKGNSSYTLTKGEGETVESGNSVAHGSTLTLTLTLGTNYTAEVKVGENALPKSEQNTYTITVTGATTITITYTAPVTLTFDGDKDNVDIVIDGGVVENYAAGTTVYFTVTAKEDFILDSVKNGENVLSAGEGNKYSVKLDSNTTITIATTEKPKLTEFVNANIVGTNLYLRFKQTGYKDVAAMKSDLTLLIGSVSVNAMQVDPDGDNIIYTIVFQLTQEQLAQLELVSGSSAEVKLHSALANKDYTKPATSVENNQNSVTFNGQDTYTLKLEDEKLVLVYEYVEKVEKKITSVYNLNVDGTGTLDFFAKQEGFVKDTLTSENTFLVIGDSIEIALSRAEFLDNDTKIHFSFALSGNQTLTDTAAVSVKVDGNSYALVVDSVDGTAWNQSYTIGTLLYTFSGEKGAPVMLAIANAPTEYKVEVVVEQQPDTLEGLGYELKNGGTTVNSGSKVPAGATLTLTVTVPENYTATVKVDGATLENNGENSYTIKDIVDSVVITITYKEKGAAPEVQTLTITKFETYQGGEYVYLYMSSEHLALVDNSDQGAHKDYYVTVNGEHFNAMTNNSGYLTEYNFRLQVYLNTQKDATEFTFNWYNADKQLVATATWKVEKAEPKITFEKGEATGDADPVVELGSPNDQGVYTVKLPENTYTAPANKYFRGWKLNEVVYFPGEQLDVKSDAVITLTAVWEDAQYTSELNVTGKILPWFTAGSLGVAFADGDSAELKYTLANVSANYHGILLDIGANGDFYRLCVDARCFYNTQDTALQATLGESLQIGGNWETSKYVALFSDGKTATQVVKISRTGNVLYVEIATYDSSDADLANAVVTATYQLTSTTAVSSLVVDFYIDGGAQATEATLKSTYKVTLNQTPSEQNPIEIGTPGNSLAYTGDAPVWTSTLRKGEKVVLTGTMTSTGNENYHATGFYLFDAKTKGTFNFRADNFVNGNTTDNVQPFSVSNGWKITGTTDGSNPVANPEGSDGVVQWWEGVRAILTQADVEITYDYTGENIILTFKATSTKQDALYNNYGHVYLCTFTIEKGTGSFADELMIGLGGEGSYTRITSLTRTSVKSNSAGAQAQGRNHTTPRNYTLTQTEEVTLNSTVTLDGGDVEWRNLLVALDDENTLKFSPKGLYLNDESEALQAVQMILDGAYSISECSISETVLDQYGAASVVITAVYSGEEISLTYSVNGQQLASVTIIGATAESYSVCLG